MASSLVCLGHAPIGLARFTEAIASETEALTLYEILMTERLGDPRRRRRIFYAHFYLGLAEGGSDRPSLGKFAGANKQFKAALTQMETPIASDRVINLNPAVDTANLLYALIFDELRLEQCPPSG